MSSGSWPYQGEEFVRLDLGNGHEFVIRDDGDPDHYVSIKVAKSNGDEVSCQSGLIALRKCIGDDREFARRMDLVFSDSDGDSDDDADTTPTGPPPVSTLPITYLCTDCGNRRVRTSLVNPRDPESQWTCDGCSTTNSPYARVR